MQEPARILIIGAGSRGYAYAKAIAKHSNGHGAIVGVAEPLPYKRREFQRRFGIADSLAFSSWSDFVAAGEAIGAKVDGVCVCTLDETHAEIVLALRPLNLHILCEKPLAVTLADCRAMQASITAGPSVLFAIGHVLRYSPHNMLLHKLLVEDEVVGEVVNINHTEPVGYWHFAHSYVRGNWRNGAPSLLTKCCHDIDLLLWLTAPHMPTSVSSHGSLVHYRRANKPLLAGSATNCFGCPAEPECIYSAKRIYIDENLRSHGNTGWPNKIVAPEIEDCVDVADAVKVLERRLEGDGQYGRCVYDAGNDVVDNQVVVLSWDDENEPRHGPKTATLTMIAHTQRICERQTKVYGTLGELTADSETITVYDFRTALTKVYTPQQHTDSGHGGGDVSLAMAFVDAIVAVKNGEATVDEAQRKYIKCTTEDAVRAHEVVFWAEQARLQKRVVEWDEWAKGQQ
ncbi:hypothetical protein BZA05DRAFT_381810 [Tricharina praecox]|uniref:uncharacterized protein n=1 Tax=Tricharina praecox TaxID=43433 RepID=UPI00221F86B4|nr:uncharacterized protein BZA05DRAFT_381810 [Tricharina praecox]KAI5858594.1 hypothetical protein BZA05DRAFT_381810 [Tricharina praecox]